MKTQLRHDTRLTALLAQSRVAFCHTLLAHTDLTQEDLDDRFWHLVDTGRARFLEGFGWLLASAQGTALGSGCPAFR